jgi:hypothetical protein
MKSLVIAAAVASFMVGMMPAPVQALDFGTLQQFRQVATECEHQGKWLRIHWTKDMEQAKARARKENKPILVFLVIGFHGEKNASDC